MASRFRLNRLDMLAIVAVIATSFLFFEAALDAASWYSIYSPISPAQQVLAVFGWFAATFGPIGIAVIFWRLAQRLRRGWVLHLLFLPCAVGLLQAGVAIIKFATGYIDFDHTLGGPVLQAYALFPIAVLAYAGSIMARAVEARKRQA